MAKQSTFNLLAAMWMAMTTYGYWQQTERMEALLTTAQNTNAICHWWSGADE